MVTRCFSLALLLALAAVPAVRAGELFVAFYNLENLFDIADDPDNPGDDEFLPAGPKKWSPERFAIKIRNLGRVIREMNGGKGPDVLGVCELENYAALKALRAELKPLGRDYRLVHKESPDKRGIDVALLYDAATLRLTASQFLAVDAGETRDIAHGEYQVGGRTLHVFANHWPSRGNPETHRITAAQTLRRRLDRLLAEDAAAEVVVLGDLNDYPTNVSLREHLKATGDRASLPPGGFYNTTWPIHEAGEGTYVFQNKWEVIDHVIVSPGLLDRQGLRWREGSTRPVKFPFQMFTPRAEGQIPRPSRSFTGNAFHADGCSDHLPIACVIEYE